MTNDNDFSLQVERLTDEVHSLYEPFREAKREGRWHNISTYLAIAWLALSALHAEIEKVESEDDAGDNP